MPGLSFLFKKRFHPSRLDNQKRIFIAEEKQAEKNEREAESAKEVMKEKEMQHYEQCGSMDFRDPRTSALKFMYATPMEKQDSQAKDGKNSKRMASVMDYESRIDHRTGEDEMVRAFRAKIVQSKLKTLSEISAQQKMVVNEVAEYDVEVPNDNIDNSGNTTKRKAAPAVSALEKELGKRRTEVTHDQMQERFAVLKNAPMEGGYAKGMAVKHQPFSELIRNVHCARCGEWGHMSGERECPLRDYNPLDYARQQREDPMRRMMDAPTSAASSNTAAPGNSSMTGKHHYSSSSGAGGSTVGGASGYRALQGSSRFVDEAGESDPEGEFLASLTRREKKLLLRKLQVIENGGMDAMESKTGADSDSDESSDDDSSSSSSSESESSDSSELDSKPRKRKRKHSKHSHKHARKDGHKGKHRRSEKKERKHSHGDKTKR